MNKTPHAAYKAGAARRKARVLKLYQRNVPVQYIAKAVGLTPQRVYQIIGPQK